MERILESEEPLESLDELIEVLSESLCRLQHLLKVRDRIRERHQLSERIKVRMDQRGRR